MFIPALHNILLRFRKDSFNPATGLMFIPASSVAPAWFDGCFNPATGLMFIPAPQATGDLAGLVRFNPATGLMFIPASFVLAWLASYW